MGQVQIRARARRDILEVAEYFEDESGIALADRFLTAVQDSFEALARTPKAGAPCGFTKPSTKRLRRWPVKDFENWLIFYLPKRNGVEIVHVLHGARDITEVLN
jgi:toxin ParE1/3/4